jgi:hypothetical protein
MAQRNRNMAQLNRERKDYLRDRILTLLTQEKLPVRYSEIRDFVYWSKFDEESVNDAIGELQEQGLVAAIGQYFPVSKGRRLRMEYCFMLVNRLPYEIQNDVRRHPGVPVSVD